MKIIKIAAMPTCIDHNKRISAGGIHESVMRAFHIVRKVRRLLECGTPAEVVLDLMDEMESAEECDE